MKLQYAHNRRLFINDYLIAGGMVVHIVFSSLNTAIGPSMYQMESVLAGLRQAKASELPTFNYNLRLQFTLTTIFWTGLWLVKLAVLVFFWRLFDSVKTRARLFWWVMTAITISTWLISVLINFFACQPLGSCYRFGEQPASGDFRGLALTG